MLSAANTRHLSSLFRCYFLILKTLLRSKYFGSMFRKSESSSFLPKVSKVTQLETVGPGIQIQDFRPQEYRSKIQDWTQEVVQHLPHADCCSLCSLLSSPCGNPEFQLQSFVLESAAFINSPPGDWACSSGTTQYRGTHIRERLQQQRRLGKGGLCFILCNCLTL